MDSPRLRSIPFGFHSQSQGEYMNRRFVLLVSSLVSLVVLGAGCSGEGETETTPLALADTSTSSAATKKEEALVIDVGPHGIAYDYFKSGDVPHGVAGDEDYLFVTQPLSNRVAVVDRITGRELTVLPPPPGGWLLPFSVRVTRSGKLVVLDAGGFPSPTVPSVARLYEYDYRQTRRRAFEATLTRTISFQGLPLVFAEDVEPLPSGGYVVSESVIGALWVVSPNGTISPGLFPDLSTGLFIPQLAACAFPSTTIGGIPFQPPGGVAPGVGALAIRNGQLYFGSSCRGGVAKVPVATLTDATRTPWARAADIVDVSPRPVGVAAESLKGFAFNKWSNCDANLYVTDTLGRRVLRINPSTGARQVVVDDPALFDFPVSAQFLPPVAGVSPLVVASDQEYRLAALNGALTSDILHPPFIVAKVYVP